MATLRQCTRHADEGSFLCSFSLCVFLLSHFVSNFVFICAGDDSTYAGASRASLDDLIGFRERASDVFDVALPLLSAPAFLSMVYSRTILSFIDCKSHSLVCVIVATAHCIGSEWAGARSVARYARSRLWRNATRHTRTIRFDLCFVVVVVLRSKFHQVRADALPLLLDLLTLSVDNAMVCCSIFSRSFLC